MRLLKWLKWFFHIGQPVIKNPFFIYNSYGMTVFKRPSKEARMQIFRNGMSYVGQARVEMIKRLHFEGRKPGCIPLIEAVKHCREIELVIKPDGKRETYVRG